MSDTASKWELINISDNYVDFNKVLTEYPCTRGTTEREIIIAQLTFEMTEGTPKGASLTILKNVPSGDHEDLIGSEISIQAAMDLLEGDNPFVVETRWVLRKTA